MRSSAWFDPDSLRGFGHRSRLKGMGFDDADYRGKPVVALLNTWSDLNTCHSHFRQRADEVKRGVYQAGGFPVEVPVMSLGEMFMKPTTMLYRNLLAMETEETLRCHPIDAAVLMGGCDKTVPALIMGAISADIPCVFLPAGPMLKARWKDVTLGSGSDAWKYWDERQAGTVCDDAWFEIETCIARSAGTCMTMGTASTMASIAESLGLTLPRAASIPAVVADHQRLAVQTGRRATEMAKGGSPKPSELLTAASFDNALTTMMALGGSTNAVVHLIAMARRAGVPLTLERFDELSRSTPILANLRPTGTGLMEDFDNAGGLPALLRSLGDRIDGSARTVFGTLGEQIAAAETIDADIIRTPENPVSPSGGTYVLRGNLAPDGCVVKAAAADPKLFRHTGPAVVFDDYPDLKTRLHEDESITPDSVLILRNAGPLSAGFPEWGMLPLPKRLLEQGVRDMVRISDARMSGTSRGMCILHVAPEAAAGGPLGLVRTGDLIELDVEARSLNMLVDDDELARRRAAWTPPERPHTRGYAKLFADHVTQANDGCDFDFLHADGRPTPEPPIF